jgi:Zn-dependent protease
MLRGSLTILRFAGIPVRIHWTFLILLAWVVGSAVARTGTIAAAINSTLFVIAVFVCVVLHEFGHAFAARAFGVRTRDITLLPIGGVAALERMPEKPWEELVVAIAGPLVNVVIALAILPLLVWRDGLDAMLTLGAQGRHAERFLGSLLAVNVWMVIFNLIPAFPMDGGRILRALLATGLGRPRATRLAAVIGQAIAVAMAFVGLFGMPMLILVALFVWLGAGAEAQSVEETSLLHGLPVSAGMIRRFQVLGVDDTLQAAAEELLAGAQQDFPVTRGGRAEDPLVGLLTRADLVRALASHGLAARVGDAMRHGGEPVPEDASLEEVVARMHDSACSLVPVTRGGRLVGLVTGENVAELLLLRGATVDRSR